MATTALDTANLASQASSGALSALGQINSAIDRVYGIQQANNAQSLAFAQQQQDWSAEQAEINRQFNSAEASKSRNWQEMMSNTAHQREVRDLMAAGLNPVLSATGGNGASVTSGATASGVMPSGSSGQVDTSLNTAIVSLLGKQLDAMTNLASMATNAVTQSNIADKNNSVSKAIAELTAGASMYNAGLSSSAMRYSSELSSSASRYAAYMANEASKYSADRSFYGAINDALDVLFGGEEGSSGIGTAVGSAISGVKTFFKGLAKPWQELASGKFPSDFYKMLTGREYPYK